MALSNYPPDTKNGGGTTPEQTLTNSRYLLNRLEQIAKVGHFEWDVLEDKVIWSDQLYRLYGLTPEQYEPSLEGYMALLHPDDREAAMAEIERAYQEGGSFESKRRIIHPDGITRTLFTQAEMIIDDQGTPVKMIGTCRDVTEQDSAERLFKGLLESAPDATVIINEAGHIVMANAQLENLFGYTTEEMVGQPLEMLIPHRYRGQHPHHRTGYFDAPRLRPMGSGMELYGLHQDGSEIPVEISLSPLETEEGILVTAAIRDITERRKMEQELRLSEERYRSFVEHSSEGIYLVEITDPISIGLPVDEQIKNIYKYGYIAACNNKFAEMYGHASSAEIVGMSIKEAHDGDDNPNNIAFIRHWIGAGYRLTDAISEEIDVDGNPVYFSNNFIGIIEDGHLIRIWGSQQDVTSRIQIRRALQESEEKYRTLFEESPISLWEEDFSGVKRYLDNLREAGVSDLKAHFDQHPEDIKHAMSLITTNSVNRATLKLYEARDKEELLTNFDLVVLPQALEDIKSELLAIAGGQTRYTGESLNKTVTGEPINVVLHWSVAPGYEHNFERVLVSVIDITEAKRNEAALRHSEARNRAMVQALPDMVTRVRADGTLLEIISPKNFPTYNTPVHVIGKKVINVLPPEPANQVMTAIHRALKTGQIQIYEIELPIEGQNRQQEGRVAPLSDDKALLIVRDITERKQAENILRESKKELEQRVAERTAELTTTNARLEQQILERKLIEVALRESEEHWRSLAENAQDLIVTIDREGIIHFANRDSKDRPSATFINTSIFDYVPEEYHPRVAQAIETVFETNQTANYEVEAIRMNGERIWVNGRMSSIKRDGQVVSAVIISTNITERKQTEEMLRQAKENAESTSRAKSEFLANMSHELRTPLNAIIGFAEVMEDQIFGPLNPKQSRYVKNIATSGQHLLQLINDLLDISKIEAGKVLLEVVPFDVEPVLEKIKDAIQPLAAKKEQTLTVAIEEPPPPGYADIQRFNQILFNLLGNAVKYTPVGGHIIVSARVKKLALGESSSQPYLWVSVCDTGNGLNPADLERIFEAFEQVDSSYSRQQEGVGLGLALTKRLVELHNGCIWAESEGEGRGSTFTFVLPLPKDIITDTTPDYND